MFKSLFFSTCTFRCRAFKMNQDSGSRFGRPSVVKIGEHRIGGTPNTCNCLMGRPKKLQTKTMVTFLSGLSLLNWLLCHYGARWNFENNRRRWPPLVQCWIMKVSLQGHRLINCDICHCTNWFITNIATSSKHPGRTTGVCECSKYVTIQCSAKIPGSHISLICWTPVMVCRPGFPRTLVTRLGTASLIPFAPLKSNRSQTLKYPRWHIRAPIGHPKVGGNLDVCS